MKIAPMFTSRKANATGMPIATNTPSAEKISRRTSHHSMSGASRRRGRRLEHLAQELDRGHGEADRHHADQEVLGYRVDAVGEDVAGEVVDGGGERVPRGNAAGRR